MTIKRGLFFIIFIISICSQIVMGGDCICDDPIEDGKCLPSCDNPNLKNSQSGEEAADYCKKNPCNDEDINKIPDGQKEDFFDNLETFDGISPDTLHQNRHHVKANSQKFKDYYNKLTDFQQQKKFMMDFSDFADSPLHPKFFRDISTPENVDRFNAEKDSNDIWEFLIKLGPINAAHAIWEYATRGGTTNPSDLSLNGIEPIDLQNAFNLGGYDLNFDYPPGTDITLDENGNLIVNGNEINLESLIGGPHSIEVDSEGNVYLDGKLLVKDSTINVDSSGPDDIFNLGSGSYELDGTQVNALNNFNVQLNGFATGESAESISIKKQANFSTQLLSLDVINPKGIMLNFSI